MICSIIIRSYNEERHIGRLLDGILKQNLPEGWEIEVIVVDSGSTDSTVSIAQHMGARIVAIRQEQFSFGRALNLGCVQAMGSILVFASAHVYPIYHDWIKKMITHFNDEKVGAVYGRQTGNDCSHFSEQQIFEKWFPLESNYQQNNPFCNNANCAIRKSLWELQQYDEHLTGLEDLDWGKKIMQKGYHIIYEASAAIVHVHEETYAKIKNRYHREAIAFKQIMPEMNFNAWDLVRLLITNTIIDWLSALHKGVFLKNWYSILLFRYMQFVGTYLGHRQKGDVPQELINRFYYPKKLNRIVNPKEIARDDQKIQYL